MSHFTHTTPGGNVLELPELRELSGTFSITKDGLHLEVFASEGNYQFKIFDVSSTKLLGAWDVKKDVVFQL